MVRCAGDESGRCSICGCDGSCADNRRPPGLKLDATPFPDPDAPEPPKYKVQRFVDRLKSILDGTALVPDKQVTVGDDEEHQSTMADDLIQEFLREMGFTELSELMDEIPRKW